MSLFPVLNDGLIAAAVHPKTLEMASSPATTGVDTAVGLAMMLTGFAIFISCLAVRRRWHEEL